MSRSIIKENFFVILLILSIVTYPIPKIRFLGDIPFGIFLILFAIIFSINKLKEKHIIVSHSRKRLFIASFLTLFSITLSSIFSDVFSASSIINLFVFIVMLLFLNIHFSEVNPSKILFAIIISGLILSIYGFYGYFTGNIGDEAKTEVWKNYSRYFGLHYTASTRNADVHYLAIPFLISICFLIFEKQINLIKRSFLFLVVLISFTGVVLSFSRSAWISLLVALLFLIRITPSNPNKFIKFSFIGVFGIFTGIFILNKLNLADYFLGKLISIFSPEKSSEFLIESVSNAERFNTILISLNIFFLHPFGVGVDNLGFYYREYGLILNHAENSYLTAMCEIGFIGIIGLLILWIYPIIIVLRNIKKQGNNAITTSTLLISIYLTITFLFNTENLNLYIWIIYSIIWGIVVWLEKKSIKDNVS